MGIAVKDTRMEEGGSISWFFANSTFFLDW